MTVAGIKFYEKSLCEFDPLKQMFLILWDIGGVWEWNPMTFLDSQRNELCIYIYIFFFGQKSVLIFTK